MTLNDAKKAALQRYELLTQWYESREPREQKVLQVLGVVVVFVLLYFILWQPALQAKESARQRYVVNTQTLQWINDNAAAIAASGEASRTPAANWSAGVSRSASEFGLTLKGFNPDQNRAVRIQLENQPVSPTILWLQAQEAKGLMLTSLEIIPGDKPGTATVRATLQP